MGENKGFSLVELVIVVAIMGILVGILAPRFLIYVEKANVSADMQTLDRYYYALYLAMADKKVLEDPVSQQFIENDMLSKVSFEDIPVNSELYKNICGTLDYTNLNAATYMRDFKARKTASSKIYFMYKGTCVNPIAMWISHTDISGKKDTSEDPSSYSDIIKCIAIK